MTKAIEDAANALAIRTALGVPTNAELAAVSDVADAAYVKPADGIPHNDLHTGIRDQLDLADTALQPGALPVGTTVTAAQVSDAGAAGRDLLKKATLPEIQSLVSEGFVSIRPPIRPLYFNRFFAEKPQALAAPGVASYVRGNFQLAVTITAGATTLEYTGGDPISAAGTTAWMGVIKIGESYQTVNVLSTSGTTITIAEPIPGAYTGAAVLGSYHDALNGQHLAPFGCYALADMFVGASPQSLRSDAAIYDADSQRGIWYATPQTAPFYSPQYWRVYGGVGNNQANWSAVINPFAAANNIFYAIGTKTAAITCSAVGHGIELPIEVNAGGAVHFAVGYGGGTSVVPASIRVVALADGLQIYSADQGCAVRKHIVPFGACKTLTLRVTSLLAGSVVIRAGRVQIVMPTDGYSRTVERGDVILPIGDSWLDENASFPEFSQRLRVLAEARGATVLPSVAVAGTQASYALAVVDGVRRIDKWIADNPTATKAIIHYYINDYNAAVTAAQWSANVSEIERTLIAAGIQPITMLPGCTASSSQTASLMLAYGGVIGSPAALRQAITECLQTELAGKTMFVNIVGKRAGTIVRCATNSGTYISSGSTDVAPWDCITAGVTPAQIVPA